MLQAMAASKKKNDRIDARKIADCLPRSGSALPPAGSGRRLLTAAARSFYNNSNG
jgi:hypothetical protein